jgi:LacI family transcriptional regulator
MTTLKDVAMRAGVSAKTVSRVVNCDPVVAEDTRASVQRYVDELNYIPNDAARQMRTQSSRVVGFLTDVIATTPYSVDIVRGAQEELRAEGRTMLIANTGGLPEVETEYWRMFRAQQAAGALYATMFHRQAEPALSDYSGPLVMVNCYDRRHHFAAVLPDDFGGGYTQARHLLELGHRRIGLVSLNPIIRAAGLRRGGMVKALADFGVGFDETLVRPGMEGATGGGERLIAFEAACELLTAPNRPTALICGHDQIALQVMAAAAACRLDVPRDLSIIGFDDQATITEALRPTLTTVALPYYKMGRLATRLLGKLIAGEFVETKTVLEACPLVVRQSCGPPRPATKGRRGMPVAGSGEG